MTDQQPVRLLALSHTGLFSGAEQVLLRVLLAAGRRGWAARCLCPPGPFADRLAAAGVEVLASPDLKLPDGTLPVAAARLSAHWLRAAPVLRRAAAEADVVLCNGLLGLPAARLGRPAAPVVWLVHDIVRRPHWRALLRLVRGAVDLALPVSDAAAAPLRAAGIPVRVVRNGTSWPVDPAPHPAPEPPVVGCVAALTPWKGQSVLLEAVAGLAGVEVELAGAPFPKDAAYAQALAERAARPDLQGRARLLGPVTDVAGLLRRWTVAVVPSVDPDPAPLAMLEAMSTGVPVVATAHGGPPEYVGGAGLLVAPGDPGALRTALERLLSDPDLRRRCGEEGRRRVEDQYQLTERTAELLDVLAATSRRRRP